LRSTAGALVLIVVGPVAAAAAEKPQLTIDHPRSGTVTSNSTPRFSGTTSEEGAFEELKGIFEPVMLELSSGGGSQTLEAAWEPGSGVWSVTAPTLSDGSYTAKASQANLLGEPGTSNVVDFTVDTTPPQVTLTSPANGSSTASGAEVVSGSASVAKGDSSSIIVQLYAGPTSGAEAPLETLVVPVVGETWTATLAGLGPGTYTVLAEQRDDAGNIGVSQPASFTVVMPAPAAGSPLVASFRSFPQSPHTGESVSLISSSTDTASPITGFAWSLAGSGPFASGKPLLTTSFATAGAHVVRLRVIDGAGRQSIATQTISVTAPPPVLMQPFPIVRIAGSETSYGVKISLLTVLAPLSTQVTVTCSGRGCKTKSESRLATASSKAKGRAGAVTLAFRRFERPLRAGVILRIRVSKAGEIGKYTSFRIRGNELPVRVDDCLLPASSKPTPCPPS
jgi:hypothetical protein